MRALLLFAVALLPTSLAAQSWGSIDLSLPISTSQFIISQQIVSMSAPTPKAPRKTDSKEAPPPPKRPLPDKAVLLVPTVSSNSAAKLASSYPAEKRADAERLFGELLSGHGRLMQQFGIAPNDMAGAVAAFVAGSHAAYHDRDIQEADFKLLVGQMRETLIANPAFAAATPAERRDAFEQLAILGMMAATVQMAVKQNPGHPQADQIRANMRKAGGDYLRGYLGIEPDKVEFGAGGLRVAG